LIKDKIIGIILLLVTISVFVGVHLSMDTTVSCCTEPINPIEMFKPLIIIFVLIIDIWYLYGFFSVENEVEK